MPRETRMAAPVSFSRLILIMVSLWDGPGPVPKVCGLEVAKLRAQAWDFQEECSLPTTMRAQAPGPMPKETMMRFYNQPHEFYCGVDLHARSMYLCILDHAGNIVLHEDLPAEPAAFLEAIAPYRNGLVVACECLFCWYWLADLCHAENLFFVLGHALYAENSIMQCACLRTAGCPFAERIIDVWCDPDVGLMPACRSIRLQPLAERQAANGTKKLRLFNQRPGCAPLTFETI